MQINKRNLPVKFIGFAAILLILIFIVENINGRFWLNDFKVYCGGALAFLHGEPVYGVLFALGSGYFKYSPFTSILFIPLSLLPYTVACVIHYFVLSGAIIGTFLVLWHIINSYLFSRRIKNANVLLSLAFVCILVHIVRELHLGNINVVLLFALSLSLLFILKSRMVWAGILLAVVIITKPFLILLFIPLILRKHIKLLFATGASLLLFVLVPAIFTGISGDIALHKDWIHTMLEHNADFPSNHTIENIIRLYISPGLASVFSFYILAAVCIGIAILILMNLSLEKKEKDNNQLHKSNFIMEWYLLIAVMPSLFKTDSQHFLLSLPLIIILLCFLSMKKNYLLIIGFVVLMCMYGANSSDLLGNILSAKLEASGILGISNLILIITTIYVYITFLRIQTSTAMSLQSEK